MKVLWLISLIGLCLVAPAQASCDGPANGLYYTVAEFNAVGILLECCCINNAVNLNWNMVGHDPLTDGCACPGTSLWDCNQIKYYVERDPNPTHDGGADMPPPPPRGWSTNTVATK